MRVRVFNSKQLKDIKIPIFEKMMRAQKVSINSIYGSQINFDLLDA